MLVGMTGHTLKRPLYVSNVAAHACASCSRAELRDIVAMLVIDSAVIAVSIAMIAITIRSSMIVKPFLVLFII